MPTNYFSPGVYVEEVSSGNAPIAGVGTSTAGFIGVIATNGETAPTPPDDTTFQSIGSQDAPVDIGTGDGTQKEFELPKTSQFSTADVVTDAGSFGFAVNGRARTAVSLKNEGNRAVVEFDTAPADEAKITGFFQLRVAAPVPVGGGTATLPRATEPTTVDLAAANEVKLCTNFSEFKKFFGDFSTRAGQSLLAHAVYGFFRNGGTRCYVVSVAAEEDVEDALTQFEAIDEIAIVAVPGMIPDAAIASRSDTLGKIRAHCEQMQDRVAVLDGVETADLSSPTLLETLKPFNSDYVALYFPWLQVFDPATNRQIFVPPSGHIAGIYARVDNQRGVFKAPANESVLGAVGLKYNLSKRQQDGLNPKGINCIRALNGNIRVWGARTLGGEDNPEMVYISVRRLMNFLRESIDEGTQWAVFEPNSPDLWARIRRNVTAFLLTVWRSGALFGTTPEEAFYVKCDAETNPPESRDRGQVITEIGVAVVKPAEFVIFRLSQRSDANGG
ncbi:phage tail sheath subtilisin-like domain-containing protein [Myxacorys almedinensis]|uniref:Phage tail sheath family protein n=1 Tax=Myxacorys almedinensis A TaxID=2690445 RepID=A0A8J8CLU0_9CYAN|nr:phage tail sheath subtilisin-like domain-containing protein [Myxacorys almedinensis]NDJ16472.1 phage tail sheath family protein [Myxacorys almedinensis A]